MFLKDEQFENIIKYAPVIAIDLCVVDSSKKLLTGKRLNAPAKGFYFVPGGRVRKNESIDQARSRLLKNELGFAVKSTNNKDFFFLGIFEHFYTENFKGDKNFNTHYIVLAYLIPLNKLIKEKNNGNFEQHEEYLWFSTSSCDNQDIHPYTKMYLNLVNKRDLN